MYKKTSRIQPSLEDFLLPFGGKLSANNRWVKEAKLIPWDLVEDLYAESFKNEREDGRPPIPARIAYGAIYIKEREKLTDERCVEHIAENAYMQYFLGLKEFRPEPLFDASMMTHFRKRFSPEAMQKINEELYRRTHQPKADGDNDPGDGGSSNKGSLIIDATVAPADIRYPTDLELLNECREQTEAIIESLWGTSLRHGHKTGYSRKKARKQYLKVAKQRKPRKKLIRQTIGKQLIYVEKNLARITTLLDENPTHKLSPKKEQRLETIEQLVKQQRHMFDQRSHVCEDRIVSLRQPHVRPIVRGKASAAVEFGQKLELVIVDGFTFLEKQSFDNFNEGVTLIDAVERYRERFGAYPEAIMADKLYRNRDNLRYCKEHGIRLSGPRLGRPKAADSQAEREQAYQDSCQRNIVEGRIGVSKRRYGLSRIMAYLPDTALTEAAMQIFIMNVAHLIRRILRLFLPRQFRGAFASLFLFFLIFSVIQ